ncbi:MAG TPA: hypothetical protein VHC19_26840 [Pirellulales bacterium]|jgi:hypothetical protein|nr:hypothetical protein [Pirellulales bacterium]
MCAKKKSSATRNSRKTPFDPDRLRKLARRLRNQASQFTAHASAMEDAGLRQIDIDGNKMLVRAMKQVDRFLRNADRDLGDLLDEE